MREPSCRGARPAVHAAWLAALACAVIAAAAAGCAARRSERPAAPEPLRVGVTATYPPLSFEEDGEIKGVEPDLARLVAAELGRPVELRTFAFDDLLPALQTGRIDVVMAGMSITRDRERQVHFTKPYLQVGQMALLRRTDERYATDYARMGAPTSRVGVERSTTGESYARANLPRATIVAFPNVGAGKGALRAGEIDYFIHDAPTVWRTTGRFEDDPDLIGMYRPLTAEYLAWAVRPADARRLGAQLDAALEELEKSGQLEAVLDRWLPVRRISRPAS